MLVSLEKQRGEPLKNDYLTFYIRHVTCKCEKKNISIAVLRNIPF